MVNWEAAKVSPASATLFLLLIYWRASGASETLSGVTQLKIGDVCWRASEASETVLGVDNAKSGIMFDVLYTSDVLEHKWRSSFKLHYC